MNEGYATVFEYLLVEREYPELRMRDLFSVIKVQGAFRPDSLERTHPMTFNGQTQSLIIYDKGNLRPLFTCTNVSFKQSISKFFSWKRNPYVPICSRRRPIQKCYVILLGSEVRLQRIYLKTKVKVQPDHFVVVNNKKKNKFDTCQCSQ